MSVMSIEMPPELEARLDRAVAVLQEGKAELVRHALQSYLDAHRIPAASDSGVETRSALEMAGDLAGCVEGPGDLLTNPKYMEDYGR